MNIERKLIISILKLTKNGLISKEIVKNDVKLPIDVAEKMLKNLQNNGLIYLHGNAVKVDGVQRLKLAVQAIKLGADIESVSSFLSWQEFEGMAALAFERNGYSVEKNLRVSHAGRMWEIDVVGCKRPLVVCVDCKHWQRSLYPSALRKVVENHVERTFALAEELGNIAHKVGCVGWDSAKLIPTVLSLLVPRSKFFDNVPIVPVLQLQDFLNQLPAYVDSLKHFTKKLSNQFDGCS
ncbi:MAG: restriction endonuclease [Candidatus Bathyarchaeia archaeon]